ncbi:hypothetical protein BMW22_15695 [Rhizobium leguminosarum]|uniref:Recombination endonuclease VII n=1 Tax=Rhizobium leguminosarum TaxID=384 RepID=A0A1L3ZB68_RHILE|nr:endonuclease VII domain-containing protein [Rhizobium leguminosarum]API52868.1 hypothetical protein BMW22_15695 [Rhizobium leguminosarum]
MTKVNPTCGACGETKQPSDFYADRKKLNGLSSYCKVCCKAKAKAAYAANPERSYLAHREWVSKNPERIRAHKAKSAYGISHAEFKALPKVCVICGTEAGLCVDHNHQSGRVRGMLCGPCNKGLGFFRDNPTLLYRAADYILGVAKADIFEATYEAA